MGNNLKPNFAPGSAAIKLALNRRHDNPIPKPKSKKMVTPSGASIKRTLSFGGGRKSKRRRKKKRRRTIKKKKKEKKKRTKKNELIYICIYEFITIEMKTCI